MGLLLLVVIDGLCSYIQVLPKVIILLPARTCGPGTDMINTDRYVRQIAEGFIVYLG